MKVSDRGIIFLNTKRRIIANLVFKKEPLKTKAKKKKDISRQTQAEGIFAYKFSLKAMLKV